MTVVDVFLAPVSTLFIVPALIVWIDSLRGKRGLTKEAIGVHDIDMVDLADEELMDEVRSA